MSVARRFSRAGNRETKSNQAIANYNRGVSYRNKGDNEKALADYERALKLNPKYANAYNGRANIKADLGDLEALYPTTTGP